MYGSQKESADTHTEVVRTGLVYVCAGCSNRLL